MRRLILLALVAPGLAPGTWLRTVPPPPDRAQVLNIAPLETERRRVGETELLGAWRLTSPNSGFGSYSALLPLVDGRFLAGSDRGARLEFSAPGAVAPAPPEFGRVGGDEGRPKELVDLEAITRDPATGRIWTAWESSNSIVRMEADFSRKTKVEPGAMRDWPSNSGPESLVRLADGRFIVLAEGAPRWFSDTYPALLFPSDPVEGAEPDEFRFAAPEGYRPVDMVQLRDGRVLVLLRRLILDLPPGFATKIVVADPADIAVGESWHGREIAELANDALTENYEGLAIESAADGAVILWLISDDNGGQFQRTLLLKLRWNTDQTRETARRSRPRQLPWLPSSARASLSARAR